MNNFIWKNYSAEQQRGAKRYDAPYEVWSVQDIYWSGNMVLYLKCTWRALVEGCDTFKKMAGIKQP